MKKLSFIFILNLLFYLPSFSRTKVPEKNSTPQIGNFSLPAAQQIFPLIAFGQNIIGKDILQLTLYFQETLGTQNTNSANIAPQGLWGVTDNFSILVVQPYAIQNRSGNSYSHGLNDTTIQFEGALYDGGNSTHALQLTLVGNISIPTGSITKNPATGFGATSFFVGPTFSYLDVKWYAFASTGVLLPMKRHKTQSGNQFWYQTGFGRNIPSPQKTIFDWLIEITGTYSGKNLINGVKNPNSGGNNIYLTPSLFFATSHWSFQAGVGYPIIQSVNGNQAKQFFQAEAAVTYTIGNIYPTT